MPRGSQVEWVKSMQGKLNRYLFFASTERPDHYCFVFNGDIIARVFRSQGSWYIWYEKPAYRMKVASFTEATKILEKEFSEKCRKKLNQNTATRLR